MRRLVILCWQDHRIGEGAETGVKGYESSPGSEISILKKSSPTCEEWRVVVTPQPMLGKCETKELNQVDNLSERGYQVIQLRRLWLHGKFDKTYPSKSACTINQERIFPNLLAVEGLGESELLTTYDVLTKMRAISNHFLSSNSMEKTTAVKTNWYTMHLNKCKTNFLGLLKFSDGLFYLLRVMLILNNITYT